MPDGQATQSSSSASMLSSALPADGAHVEDNLTLSDDVADVGLSGTEPRGGSDGATVSGETISSATTSLNLKYARKRPIKKSDQSLDVLQSYFAAKIKAMEVTAPHAPVPVPATTDVDSDSDLLFVRLIGVELRKITDDSTKFDVKRNIMNLIQEAKQQQQQPQQLLNSFQQFLAQQQVQSDVPAPAATRFVLVNPNGTYDMLDS